MTNDTKITQHTDAHGHEQTAVRTGGKFATKGEREGAAAALSSVSSAEPVSAKFPGTLRHRRGHDFIPARAKDWPRLHGSENNGKPIRDHVFVEHYFASNMDIWVSEYDPETMEAYTYAEISSQPENGEYGYMQLDDLESSMSRLTVSGAGSVSIPMFERDLDFGTNSKADRTASKVTKKYREEAPSPSAAEPELPAPESEDGPYPDCPVCGKEWGLTPSCDNCTTQYGDPLPIPGSSASGDEWRAKYEEKQAQQAAEQGQEQPAPMQPPVSRSEETKPADRNVEPPSPRVYRGDGFQF